MRRPTVKRETALIFCLDFQVTDKCVKNHDDKYN